MAYGIALTLDQNLDSQVRHLWRKFEAAGIGKTPGQSDEPPHITLSVFPSGNPATLIELVEATPVADSGIKLIPLGAFLGEKHVLYYSAALSRGLIEAHARHFEIVRTRNIEHSPMYLPGNIVFHCTIAVDIEPEQLVRGIEICLENRKVLEGTAENIELLEFFPVKVIHTRRIVE